MKYAPIDRDGRRIRKGDWVRLVSLPDLRNLLSGKREVAAVFKHILGTYKRVASFNRYGHAELSFRIRTGRLRGLRSVWVEPEHLKLRLRRRPKRT